MNPGREWEILVAQLETLFAGPGFEVRSPDNVRSKRTGNVEKVDVTVRGKVGSQDILIAFECRDRDDHQGKDWLQQLATRKQDIGASELVAVSRDGFTADAEREAAAYGIPLRTLTRLQPAELASLVLGIELHIGRPQYNATGLDATKMIFRQFGLDPLRTDWPTLTPELLQEVVSDPHKPRFIDQLEHAQVSVADLIHRSDWKSAFTQGAFEGKRDHRASLPTQYEADWGKHGRYQLFIEPGYGIELVEVTFLGEVWWKTETVPFSAVMRYAAESGTLAMVAEFDLTPHGFDETLQLFIVGEPKADGS